MGGKEGMEREGVRAEINEERGKGEGGNSLGKRIKLMCTCIIVDCSLLFIP